MSSYVSLLALLLPALFIWGLFIRFRKYDADSDPKGVRFNLTYVEFFLMLVYVSSLGNLFCTGPSCVAGGATLIIMPPLLAVLGLLGVVLLLVARKGRTWRISDWIRLCAFVVSILAFVVFLAFILFGSYF